MWDSWFQPLDDQCQSQFLTTPTDELPFTKLRIPSVLSIPFISFTSLATKDARL